MKPLLSLPDNTNLVDVKPRVLRNCFLDAYCALFPKINRAKAEAYLANGERFRTLCDQWYQYLDNNNLNKAYRVYNDDYYFTDIWTCFSQYSRTYLRALQRPCLMNGQSIVDATRTAKVIVDLGCGVGLTTAALKQLYPRAKVYGTNLKDTKQWSFCQRMAKQYDFTLVDDVKRIKQSADVVFASEYFEHIHSPIDHLAEIIDAISPRHFLIANAFKTYSIGHFRVYQDTTGNYGRVVDVPERNISRLHNKYLRDSGYEAIKTTLFNQKPKFWSKKTSLDEN